MTVGYLYGLMDNRAIRVMQNCFQDGICFYSPLFRGTYDFLIKQIQNESKNVMQIDFTRGDEPYKYKLGGIEMQLHNYIIKEGKIEFMMTACILRSPAVVTRFERPLCGA